MTEKFICNFDEPIVKTKKGKLRGYLWGNIYHFLGVRYGKAKRFLPPEPEQAWDGVKDAIVYGEGPLVAFEEKAMGLCGYESMLSQKQFWPRSEDCLNLNVWTPSIDPAAKKPVMVWIMGGGFHAGAANESAALDGSNLSEFGDAVVVSVNHRISLLGFFDLAPFGEKYRYSANSGLMDLVLALSWIRENIAAFGGDPNNITLFGHSGGACKLWALMQTAAADGLYDRCIMQSGFAGNMVFPKPGDNGYTIVSKTLKALGLGDNDAEKLEDMPYDRLLSAYMSAYSEESAKYNADGVYRYVGKTVLPNDYFAGYPFDVGMREQSKRIPVIIGSALAEQQSLRLNVAEHKNMKTETERLEALRSIYGEQTEKVAALWKSAYPDKNLLDMINYETVFRAKVLEFCDLKAAWNAPAYLYLFALESPFNGGLPAHHGAEVPYVFHNTDKTPATNNPGVSEVVEEQICRAWVGFARSGDPNHEKLPFWPKYTSESPATMIFDNPTRVGVGFDAELVALNNALIPWRRFPI